MSTKMLNAMGVSSKEVVLTPAEETKANEVAEKQFLEMAPVTGKESLHKMPALTKEGSKRQAQPAAEKAAAEDMDDTEIGALTIEEALAKFNTTREGLSNEEAKKRILQYGENALKEVKINKCLQFVSFANNPLSWVMEAAAIVAIVLSNGPQPWIFPTSQFCPVNTAGGQINNCPSMPQTSGDPPPDYPDFIGILLLLLVNCAIGFYEESKAGDAVSALMSQLAPNCRCKRDGKWETIAARELVPGDIITIKLGDIIPADGKVLEGEPLKVDQAGLTGESLPVTKDPGDEVYSSCVVKRGEIEVLVHATGENTFFGKAATLVAGVEEHGHLQQVLKAIGLFCISYIGIWIVIFLIVLYGVYGWAYRGGINMILVVLIGGIPIAMPTVLSVTMAMGVGELAKQKAIVTRITAVEVMAGMDILCSDKTGTLTLNKLSVVSPLQTETGYTELDCIRIAALAAKREGAPDAIDQCIHDVAKEQGVAFEKYTEKRFVPFDPVGKRTEATVEFEGKRYIMSKGAPQVMINLAHNADEIRPKLSKTIDDFAQRGYRMLGVAQKIDTGSATDKWDFVGLIPLHDPPRHDTAKTIEEAQRLGVTVKMITGDQVAIGKETARRLGMGLNFHNAKVVRAEFVENVPIADIVEQADGFGEVFPEDKYRVVEILRKIKHGPFGGPHVVGMTGDGVNDAPALKVSDIGIAVHGATDAARAAADMVLLTPGLNVIIAAIIGSRCIFQRMKNYAMYACATTIRIVTTFGVLAVVWQFSFPPFMVLIIAYLNDGTIMTISRDFASPSPTPDAWRLIELFSQGGVIGIYLTISTVVFFVVIIYTTFFDGIGASGLLKINSLCKFYESPAAQNYGATLNPPAKDCVANQISNNCADSLRALNIAGDNAFLYAKNNDCLVAYQKTFGNNQIGMMTNAAIYLQVSITGQLVIFSTRARLFFFMDMPSPWLMGAFLVAQLIATLIAVYANFPFTAIQPMGPTGNQSWGWAAIVWVWSILWFIPLDLFKIAVSWAINGNPWTGLTEHRKALNFALNGGASHLGSKGGSRMGVAQNSRAYARASAARANQMRASAKK